MWKVLGIAVEKGYAKDIILEYNSNGTEWPEETELFRHFKLVNLSFSIDGIGDQFHYMRFPAEWDILVNTMNKARALNKESKNMYFGWCMSLSPLNIFYVRELLDEQQKNFTDFGVYLNLIHGPLQFNINQLPKEYHDVVIDKLLAIPKEYNVHHYTTGIIEFIRNGNPDPAVWQKFLRETAAHDKYRNQSYSKTFPEFAKIIGFKPNE
jgi:hypothetical protein